MHTNKLNIIINSKPVAIGKVYTTPLNFHKIYKYLFLKNTQMRVKFMCRKNVSFSRSLPLMYI